MVTHVQEANIILQNKLQKSQAYDNYSQRNFVCLGNRCSLVYINAAQVLSAFYLTLTFSVLDSRHLQRTITQENSQQQKKAKRTLH